MFEPYKQKFQDAFARYAQFEQANPIDDDGIPIALPGKPAVKIALPMFTGLRLAYHRHKDQGEGAVRIHACQWNDTDKKISFDWDNKRRTGKLTRDGQAMTLAPLSYVGISHVYTDAGLEIDRPQYWTEMEIEAMPDGSADFRTPGWEG